MAETCCENNFPCYFEIDGVWIMECPYCGRQTKGATKAEAMAAWNRRF